MCYRAGARICVHANILCVLIGIVGCQATCVSVFAF